MSGLNALQSIEHTFKLFANTQIESLSGLDNLTSIGSSLEISGNENLINLTGLEGVHSIGSALSISNNMGLNNFSGYSRRCENTTQYIFDGFFGFRKEFIYLACKQPNVL